MRGTRHVVIEEFPINPYTSGRWTHLILPVDAQDPLEALVEEVLRRHGQHGEAPVDVIAGEELLPVSAGQGVVEVEVPRPGQRARFSVEGDVDLRTLAEFRARRLTADWDWSVSSLGRLLWKSRLVMHHCVGCEILRTARGMHLRATLMNPLPLSSRLTLREELLDDKKRLEHDRMLASLGLEGLAEALFERKLTIMSVYEGIRRVRRVSTSVEEPLMVSSVELPGRVPWDLELEHEGVKVRVRHKLDSCELILPSPVPAGELVRILQGISRELETMMAFESIRDAYWRVHHSLLEVIDRYWSEGRIEIDAEEGSVVIRALPDDAGKLIGRGGSTVSAVELETGLRIRITVEGQDMRRVRRDLSELKDRLMGDWP